MRTVPEIRIDRTRTLAEARCGGQQREGRFSRAASLPPPAGPMLIEPHCQAVRRQRDLDVAARGIPIGADRVGTPNQIDGRLGVVERGFSIDSAYLEIGGAT